MDKALIDNARNSVPSIPVLTNMVSKRIKQLIKGDRPYVRPLTPDEELVDVVMREIGEGKLIAEMNFQSAD